MLSDREIYKVIPKTFTICCHPIKVIVKDEIVYHDENEGDVHRYGQWNEVACTIELAKSITIDEVNGMKLPIIYNLYFGIKL